MQEIEEKHHTSNHKTKKKHLELTNTKIGNYLKIPFFLFLNLAL